MDNNNVNIFGEPFYQARQVVMMNLPRGPRRRPLNIHDEAKRLVQMAVAAVGGAGALSYVAVKELFKVARNQLRGSDEQQFITPTKGANIQDKVITAEKRKQISDTTDTDGITPRPNKLRRQILPDQGTSLFNFL